MKFYHGTSKENWKRIQEEGILFGIRDKCPSRCTYLTPILEESKSYGEVILEVEYNPYDNPKMNNYVEDCWQVRVYEPIPISNIKLL